MKSKLKKSMIILALILGLASIGVLAQGRQRRDRDRNQQRNVQTVYCESGDMRRHWCSEGIGAQVRLIKQKSDAACIKGRTWGVGRNGIWVDRGCRADFEVSN